MWLIDHDHKEDEKEDGVEEKASDAACLTGRAGSLQTAVDEPHQSDNQDSSSGSGSGHIDATLGEALPEDRWRRRQHERGCGAKASGAGRGRMKTNEKGEPFEDPGKTVASMMASLNRVIRHLRDQKREYLYSTRGPHGGPASKENFQRIWSSVRYDRHVAAHQDQFDRIFHDNGADRLVDDAIQPQQAMPLRDAWPATRALVKGVAEIATKLNAADLHYKTRSSSVTA